MNTNSSPERQRKLLAVGGRRANGVAVRGGEGSGGSGGAGNIDDVAGCSSERNIIVSMHK